MNKSCFQNMQLVKIYILRKLQVYAVKIKQNMNIILRIYLELKKMI